MIPSRRVLFVLFSALILADAVAALGQSRVPDFNRPRTFDVQKYRIAVSFDRPTKSIVASTTVILKPLADGFRRFSLDAEGLQFSSAVLVETGSPLPYTVGSGKVNVTLPRDYPKGAELAVRFDYRARPRKGVYFVDETRAGGRVVQSAQIWTQGEPEEARHWFPSYDFPDDKATTEQIITAEDGETVVANGELKKVTPNGNGTTTFSYSMNVPHSTYLVSFVIGRFVRLEDVHGTVPLGFYLYPSRPNLARPIFAKTREMMAAYEALTGTPYAFNKYDQTIVADFNFGGMENITATTLSDRDVFLAETPLGKEVVEDLVSHELAHSWFGNLVTCRNWAELWLNEGFATFMEAAWREKAYGRENYIAKLRADAAEYFFADERGGARHGLYNLLAKPDDSLFDSITYKKGGAVVHMLRDTVGDEIFWRAIKKYLERHRFGNVTSRDLQQVFEEESKKDLGWFFDQWVYGVGHPRLKATPVYNSKTRMLTITVSQVQSATGLTPAVFRIPLEFRVETPSGARTVTMVLSKRTETASFAMDDRPTAIDADPDFRVPIKIIDVASTVLR